MHLATNYRRKTANFQKKKKCTQVFDHNIITFTHIIVKQTSLEQQYKCLNLWVLVLLAVWFLSCSKSKQIFGIKKLMHYLWTVVSCEVVVPLIPLWQKGKKIIFSNIIMPYFMCLPLFFWLFSNILYQYIYVHICPGRYLSLIHI